MGWLDDSGTRISPEQRAVEDGVVASVLGSFDATTDPRLRQLLRALVLHLHSFIREVRLTEEEWANAIEFLTAVGHTTTDKRHEFILLSDVVGASTQTVAVNNEVYENTTEATVFGPFFVGNSPQILLGGDIAARASGEPCWVEGTVVDTYLNPVAGARIEVWEADGDGFYDVQYSDDRVAARGHLFTDEEGGYRFWGLRPTPYPIPHDGPVGRLLDAAGRSPMRPAHLHFMVTGNGQRSLVTHVFVAGDPQLDAGDAVFGVKNSLVKEFAQQKAGTPTPDGRDLGDRVWSRIRFDIVLGTVGHRAQ